MGKTCRSPDLQEDAATVRLGLFGLLLCLASRLRPLGKGLQRATNGAQSVELGGYYELMLRVYPF